MNCMIIRKNRDKYYSQKNTSFDILNLIDQLHKSKSIYLKGQGCDKINFSKNYVPNLMKLRLNHLS